MAVYRLWPATSGPGAATADTENYTLGTEFEVSSNAEFTGWYFWCQTAATVTFSLYQVDSTTTGTLVGQVSNVSLTAPLGVWKYQAATLPVTLTPGQRYRACVTSSTTNFYCATSSYWTSGAGGSGVTNGILTAPNTTNATGADQGSFVVGASPAFPNSGFNGSNYWIDPEVSDTTSSNEGTISGTISRAITINGERTPVGALTGSITRNIQVVGKKVCQGSITMSLSRNVSVTGGFQRLGSVNIGVTRNITITGQHPADVLPPAPGITRSDIEYNYQQWLYTEETDPYSMLDYFHVNDEDKSKLNRPPEL